MSAYDVVPVVGSDELSTYTSIDILVNDAGCHFVDIRQEADRTHKFESIVIIDRPFHSIRQRTFTGGYYSTVLASIYLLEGLDTLIHIGAFKPSDCIYHAVNHNAVARHILGDGFTQGITWIR